MEKVAATMSGKYGDEFVKVSGDVWIILIDKAEAVVRQNQDGPQRARSSGVRSLVPLVYGCVGTWFGGAGEDADASSPA